MIWIPHPLERSLMKTSYILTNITSSNYPSTLFCSPQTPSRLHCVFYSTAFPMGGSRTQSVSMPVYEVQIKDLSTIQATAQYKAYMGSYFVVCPFRCWRTLKPSFNSRYREQDLHSGWETRTTKNTAHTVSVSIGARLILQSWTGSII